jgi:hypothetical protein
MTEWIPFPGDELLGERPPVECAGCRNRASGVAGAGSPKRTICFQCYRAHFERRRRLAASLEALSASEGRFLLTQPFESVDHERLARLRHTRELARADAARLSRFDRRRRDAQIAARHLLDSGGVAGAAQQRPAVAVSAARVVQAVASGGAVPLQMPLAWLPFLMSR